MNTFFKCSIWNCLSMFQRKLAQENCECFKSMLIKWSLNRKDLEKTETLSDPTWLPMKKNRNKLSQNYEFSGIFIIWKPWKLEPSIHPPHQKLQVQSSKALVFMQPNWKTIKAIISLPLLSSTFWATKQEQKNIIKATLEILLDCQWKRNKLSQTYESSGISIFWKSWKLEPPPTHPIKNFGVSRVWLSFSCRPNWKTHQCHNLTFFIFLNFLSNQTGTQKQYKTQEITTNKQNWTIEEKNIDKSASMQRPRWESSQKPQHKKIPIW